MVIISPKTGLEGEAPDTNLWIWGAGNTSIYPTHCPCSKVYQVPHRPDPTQGAAMTSKIRSAVWAKTHSLLAPPCTPRDT